MGIDVVILHELVVGRAETCALDCFQIGDKMTINLPLFLDRKQRPSYRPITDKIVNQILRFAFG